MQKKKTRWPTDNSQNTAKLLRQLQGYFLFVLGSGGHTKEMLLMMDDGFCNFGNTHRRYLISSGDKMSENHLTDYEEDVAKLSKANDANGGTFDKIVVTRARRVHQSIWTTPLSAAISVAEIVPALLFPPRNAVGRKSRYPDQVFSNGPATGLFVALVIHALKMLYIVPEGSMKFIYIESWARISTLSLTGKLLYYTGIADIFMVQHQDVAVKYGLVNAGEMVFNSRRPDL